MSDPPLMPPCLICGKMPERAFPMSNIPSGALMFASHGSAHSAALGRDDPYQSLAVNVCDGCLWLASGAGRVVLLTHPEPERREPQVAAWKAGG